MNKRVLLVPLLICLLLLLLFSNVQPYAERNNMGVSLYEQGEYEAAILAYQNAEVQAPDQPESYYNAASALAETGRLRDAEASLEQALRTADATLIKMAYFNLGNIYYQMAAFNDAIGAYREILIRDPEDQDARHNYELALRHSEPTLSPTPQEQQTNPEEDQTDPETEPTNNPAAEEDATEIPTATPLPPDNPPEGPLDGLTPTRVEEPGGTPGPNESTPVPQDNGPSTLDEIERQLDGIQADQRTLREFLNDAATPGAFREKDW